MRQSRTFLALAGALALSACFGGAKVPPTLMTLTADRSATAAVTRNAAEGEAITVAQPIMPRALETLRVPVYESPTAISYIKDAQWVEMPSALFGRVIGETIASSGRVVLNANQFSADPGIRLTGTLERFGFDAPRSEVVAVYDAVLARRQGGVTTRRFEARIPVAAADPALIAPALNQATNQIASEVAGWIG